MLLLEEEDNKLSILIYFSLTSSVTFLSQIIALILFSFSIQNLNSFTKSLFLIIRWESLWIKKIELSLCVTLLSVYRYSDVISHDKLVVQ